jgi:hypothetical protein
MVDKFMETWYILEEISVACEAGVANTGKLSGKK